jgi:hypothetical protein
MGENGERETKCMPCVVARIYIVGSLVVVKRGVRVRRNCNISNLAMENVLKISCPDMIPKCTSNVHIFLITFKLRDRKKIIISKSCATRNDRFMLAVMDDVIS